MVQDAQAADQGAVFLLVPRGLEDIAATEVAAVASGRVHQEGDRRLAAIAPLAACLRLRCVDDAFLDLGTWQGIAHTRAALEDLATRLRTLVRSGALDAALARVGRLRPLPRPVPLYVSVSSIGARNYSGPEVRARVGPVLAGHGRVVVERDDAAAACLRLALVHDRAFVGLRLGARPLQERGAIHRPGRLSPPIAAAMARWVLGAAPSGRGRRLLDPCCGTGTILQEASWLGAVAIGADWDGTALQGQDGAGWRLRADAHRLPFAAHAFAALATNLPWERQVGVHGGSGAAAALAAAIGAQVRRLLRPGGRAAILTPHAPALGLPEGQGRTLRVHGAPTVLWCWEQPATAG